MNETLPLLSLVSQIKQLTQFYPRQCLTQNITEPKQKAIVCKYGHSTSFSHAISAGMPPLSSFPGGFICVCQSSGKTYLKMVSPNMVVISCHIPNLHNFKPHVCWSSWSDLASDCIHYFRQKQGKQILRFLAGFIQHPYMQNLGRFLQSLGYLLVAY